MFSRVGFPGRRRRIAEVIRKILSPLSGGGSAEEAQAQEPGVHGVSSDEHTIFHWLRSSPVLCIFLSLLMTFLVILNGSIFAIW